MTQPASDLFRQEALQHHLRAEEGRGLARVSPPWSWALLWTVMAFVGFVLVFSIAGRVEVNGRGRGILRPGSVRSLVAQVGGTVVGVQVQSGQEVKTGTSMLRIDSAASQSQLLEAQRQVQILDMDYKAYALRQDRMYEEQQTQLRQRLAMLQDLVKSQEQSLAGYERKVMANKVLAREGIVSSITVDDAQEALALAQRQVSGSRQALVQAKQELASLHGRRQDELWQREQATQSAKSKVEAIGLNVDLGVFLAPEDGVVEAILVKPGDVVQPGQVVGRLVPRGDPLQVVAFLPEKDRAFVKVNDNAHLELDQLPYSEYGTLKARVLRIGDDLASSYEIQEALGAQAKFEVPGYRIELTVTDDKAAREAGVHLRTGMLLNARLTLRKQRPITLVLDPLRRWFK